MDDAALGVVCWCSVGACMCVLTDDDCEWIVIVGDGVGLYVAKSCVDRKEMVLLGV